MTRFFVSEEQMKDDHILLDDQNAAHARVLRLKPGEQVKVCDGQGMECLCQVEICDSQTVSLQVISRQQSASEAAVRVSIYMGFPKADKLEHVIQKATELGAYEIVTFPTARCVSRPDEKSLKKKLERWQKIAESAAEQSGRGIIPRVIVLKNYQEALERAGAADRAILFYENEHATTLKMALSSAPYHTVSLITGPEGGLEESEVQQAVSAGLQVCTLGSRILRCETAPLCGLAAVMYDSGEF